MNPSAESSESFSGAHSSSSTSSDTVRYLSIRLLDPTDAIATWAPPNGTTATSYTAEISYDGNQWRHLSPEEPDATFITFMVTEQKDFQIRVTPEGGAPTVEPFTLSKHKGKSKMMGKKL